MSWLIFFTLIYTEKNISAIQTQYNYLEISATKKKQIDI